jgi:hypothetical protein
VPLSKLKALGNKPFKPVIQSVGTHEFDSSHQDLNRFSILAKRYVIDGPDKVTICEINAQVALQAEHYQVFQMWCLLRSLFSPAPASPRVSRPPTPPLSPLSLSSRILPHSRPAPPAITTSSSVLSPTASLPPPDTPRGLSSDTMLNSHTPYPTSGDSPRPASSASPSNSPSPRNVSNTAQVNSSPQSALSTPSTTSARSPTIFSRYPSSTAFLANRPRGFSSIRRPSVSTPSLVPSDNSTSPSLRHVGEGTLDDSDSSGSESGLSSLPSASVLSPTTPRTAHSIGHPHPSPLSRIAAAGHQTWTEDEREVDDDSPSPASTETESDGEMAPMRTRARSQSLRRRAGRRSSHSATRVAAPGPIQPVPISAAAHVLPRPSSRSSLRTVTAHDDGDHEPFIPSAQLTNDSRVTSVTKSLSDGLFGSGKDSHGAALDAQDVYVRNSVRRRVEDVREAICCALREALDERAEAGDVQTCAMVTLVAEGVLRIGTHRVQLFVEAYIGTSAIVVLVQLELWCQRFCAYRTVDTDEAVHHHSVSSKALSPTGNTFCDQCKESSHSIRAKFHFILLLSFRQPSICLVGGVESPSSLSKAGPCVRPADPQQRSAQFGTFFFLFFKKKKVSFLQQLTRKHIFSHLPVKSMLFQCAICSHGGHQACYRRFYAEIPLSLLPAPQAPSPGSPMKFPPRLYRSVSASRSKDRECDDATDIVAPDDSFDTSTVTPAPRELMGHPCARGCGHFCWVANFREDDVSEKP